MDQETQAQSPSLPKTILIVEDDESIGQYLVEVIRQETPYHSLLVTNSLQALEVVEQVKPSLLLLDYHLVSSTNGIELYDQLHSIHGFERIPAIIMSASLPHAALELEIKKRNLMAVPSPHELDELLAALQTALM
jgi:CheY-like chemotaxis protein